MDNYVLRIPLHTYLPHHTVESMFNIFQGSMVMYNVASVYKVNLWYVALIESIVWQLYLSSSFVPVADAVQTDSFRLRFLNGE